ncbi:hypothetical protein G5S_0711 [Chlamydia pecorum E58]|uniref:Uncharacterized protein n=1 Tax=Chlamydia pecorum (strain ATCC VR-628 / DSM 29919 / E58) TaxID=331635 RepID=A0AA34WI18_CHLPE|nr:hypothetical protein G5S_0711 [Chlamydia pecorum E58]
MEGYAVRNALACPPAPTVTSQNFLGVLWENNERHSCTKTGIWEGAIFLLHFMNFPIISKNSKRFH